MPDEECIDPLRAGKCTFREGGARAHEDLRIGELAGRQHGVVARRQLFAFGMSRHQVDGRIQRGSLRAIYPSVYAVGYRANRVEARWMAATLACGEGAVLSHRSAGQLWQVLPRSPHLPEITRPGHRRGTASIVSHRTLLPDDEVTVLCGIPVTSPFRTLFDLAGLVTRRQLERALHEAEVRQATDKLSLHHLLERYPGHRGNRALRELLVGKEPAGITENDFEEMFVAFLDSYGLPRPRFNATLPLRGRLLRPDCMWAEQRLIVELDGRAVHGTDKAFEGDRRRDRELLADGWRSMRVTWLQLRDEPAALAADLRGLLAEPASANR